MICFSCRGNLTVSKSIEDHPRKCVASTTTKRISLKEINLKINAAVAQLKYENLLESDVKISFPAVVNATTGSHQSVAESSQEKNNFVCCTCLFPFSEKIFFQRHCQQTQCTDQFVNLKVKVIGANNVKRILCSNEQEFQDFIKNWGPVKRQTERFRLIESQFALDPQVSKEAAKQISLIVSEQETKQQLDLLLSPPAVQLLDAQFPRFPEKYNIHSFHKYIQTSGLFDSIDFSQSISKVVVQYDNKMCPEFLELMLLCNESIKKVSYTVKDAINGQFAALPHNLSNMNVFGEGTILSYAKCAYQCLLFFDRKLGISASMPLTIPIKEKYLNIMLHILALQNSQVVLLKEFLGLHSFHKRKKFQSFIRHCVAAEDFNRVESDIDDGLLNMNDDEADDDSNSCNIDDADDNGGHANVDEGERAADSAPAQESGNKEFAFKSLETMVFLIRGIIQMMKRVQVLMLVQRDDAYVQNKLHEWSRKPFMNELIHLISFLKNTHSSCNNGQASLYCVTDAIKGKIICSADHPNSQITATTMPQFDANNFSVLMDRFASVFRSIAQSESLSSGRRKKLFQLLCIPADGDIHLINSKCVHQYMETQVQPIKIVDTFVDANLHEICRDLVIQDVESQLFIALALFLSVRCGPAPRSRDWISLCGSSLIARNEHFYLMLHVQKTCSSITKGSWMLDRVTCKIMFMYFAIFREPIVKTISPNCDVSTQLNIMMKCNSGIPWLSVKLYRVMVSLMITHYFSSMNIQKSVIDAHITQMALQSGHTRTTNDGAAYSNHNHGMLDIQLQQCAYSWSQQILCMPFCMGENDSNPLVWRWNLYNMQASLNHLRFVLMKS